MLPEGIPAHSRRRLTAVRAARLIDALIDHAHSDWPETCFVLRMPSGEDVFLPAHRSGGTPCPLGHAGYFRDRVRPFCASGYDPSCRDLPRDPAPARSGPADRSRLTLWLEREFPAVEFERFADDAVVHCLSLIHI